MTVVTSEVGVGNVSGQSFYAAIDTIIYGRQYVQGQEVDTSSWNRRQILQYLSLGLIIGPPVSSEGTPAYMIPCTVITADQSARTALVLMPSGQLLRDVKVTGTSPNNNTTATLVTTTNDRWVIGSGVPSDLVVDSIRTGSLNVVGDTTLMGDTSISKGAEPGWIATSADELGTVQWAPPAGVASAGGAIISDGVAPPTDGLAPGAIWYNPSEGNNGPSFWTAQNTTVRTSAATVNGTFGKLPQFGGYTTTVPSPGAILCEWTASIQAASGTAGIRLGLWGVADAGGMSTYVYASNGPGSTNMVSGMSHQWVNQATDIDWDWRGYNTSNVGIVMGPATIRFSFYPNAVTTYTNY